MKTKNIQEIQKILQTMSFKVNNLKPFMHTIGEKAVAQSMDAFANERDPITGQNWSPISSNSLYAQTGGKRKAFIKSGSRHTKSFQRKRANKKVLRDQGMRGGLMSSVDYEATSNSTTILADKEYAATHFFGDEDRNIEQRRYLPFTDDGDISNELKEDIIEGFQEFIFEEY